ncbi:MAG: NTP transferase domain-containing protein, partial [Ignavibacteria bacterium]|nr:NTP transferase domain-containing protein [Ignavibacteria bacterium]
DKERIRQTFLNFICLHIKVICYMKALILSAGFGTRLKPLTDTTPKALIQYKGKPLIVHQIEKLKSIGINEIVVNVHHLKEKIIDFFDSNDFGIKVNISDEEEILGTGGGIINAEKFFKDETYFLVVNADIISDVDISKFIRSHSQDNFATLAVQKRKTSRYLEFDEEMNLIGRANEKSHKDNLYAFNAMHVISQDIFKSGYKAEFKDIIEIYLEELQKGKTIKGYDVGAAEFKDIGKHKNLN